jgi:hypothetical protein
VISAIGMTLSDCNEAQRWNAWNNWAPIHLCMPDPNPLTLYFPLGNRFCAASAFVIVWT